MLCPMSSKPLYIRLISWTQVDSDEEITPKSATMVRRLSSSKRSKRDRSPPSPPSHSHRLSSKSRVSHLRSSSIRSSSTRPQYVSAYRRNVPTVTYDTFQFEQITCEVNASGTASLIVGDIKTVLIGRNWQSQMTSGKPAGAYLSKGMTKYVFRVSFVFSAILLP